MDEITAPPSAAALIESMRDFGYSLETAVADIIDNSITAGAKSISIFSSAADSAMRIAIIDDGCGMSSSELRTAMQPGSRNPLEKRSKADLGRFGLGLKTASFSQCRRVTVVSRINGETSAACWDLDLVQERDAWVVQLPSDVSELPWIDRLGKSGTLVLWEKLDRFAGEASSRDDAAFNTYLNGRLADVVSHLELVFHRFLSGERSLKRVRMDFNSRPLEAFDPFHSDHPATTELPPEEITLRAGDRTERIKVQPFVLPYHKKVSASDWAKYAGPGGYLKNQGFYVYRGKRLIIHGTWFGLARQEGRTQLARVRVDISNELDAEWKIDVRKASAQLPFVVRKRLREILEKIEIASRQPIVGRGYVAPIAGVEPVWQRAVKHDSVTYSVNPAHPAIEAFSVDLDSETSKKFLGLLQIISAALPIDPIFSDLGSNPEKVRGEPVSHEFIDESMKAVIRRLRADGLSADAITKVLAITPPYSESLGSESFDIEQLLKDC
jgi:anti-sigma regulatory factor (Ser/Thr protein kinase)